MRQPTTVYIYKYNNASWRDQLSAIETYSVNANGVVSLANTQSYTYDSMGNPINYNGVSLTWQGKQLKSHATTNGYMTTVLHFSYDENGLRTEKGFASNKTYYYYNGSVLIGMQKGNITQRFSYDSSGKVVSVNYNGTDYYYLRNAQGDIVKLIDNNSNTVVEYTYDSWGKILSTTGSKAATLGTDQPFRYRGYVYDNETGWYYLQSRYYDPSTNRFISSDILLSTGQGVLGHNSYAYCLNNPVNSFDDNGEWSLPNWAKIAIGVAAIAVGVVATVATGGAAAPAILAGVKVACIAGAVSAGTSAVTTAISSASAGESISTVAKKSAKAAIDGFADGFMMGGIMAGASQVASATFKIAANAGAATGRSAGVKVGKTKLLSPDAAWHKNNGGTLIKIGKTFRIDVSSNHLLHMHIPKSTKHIPIGAIGAAIYGWLKQD